MSAASLAAHRAARKISDTYADSMVLLVATSVMSGQPGIGWAGAVMAAPAALADLAEQGFEPADLAGADANDLVLAVHAADEEKAQAALAAGADAIFSAAESGDAQIGVVSQRRWPWPRQRCPGRELVRGGEGGEQT